MENKKNKEEFSGEVEIMLNLIPPDRKEKIAESKRMKLVIKLEILMTFLLVLFFVVLGSFRYILNIGSFTKLNLEQGKEQMLQSEKIKNYDDQFNNINSQISKIITVKKEQLHWSILFGKLSELVFPGVSIESLITSDYTVTVLGVASTREDLILFKEKLEAEDCFSEVDLPLSDLVGKDNVEFQIDFTISGECLRKKIENEKNLDKI